MDDLPTLENELLGGALLFSLSAMLLLEHLRPRQPANENLGARWLVNFGMFFADMTLQAWLRPISAVALALWLAETDIGLFNNVQAPAWLVCVVGALAMDFFNYAQHYCMHKVPILWRIHRTHHADSACDVTTYLRFHPLEGLVSIAVDLAVIMLLGLPAALVLSYRILRLLLSAMVHSNTLINPTLDALLRRVIVTPDVHRIHHSRLVSEQNSNFSGGLLWWDYLFGTYRPRPAMPYQTMLLGLDGYEQKRSNSLWRMLLDPFITKETSSIASD